ncbi:hypothetical protein HXX76_004295 [Chlamydomonas incerta]|uniref:SAP domain-containing protein n=1 Tax=Chlamydomonas incerta TaxID=51695 RepID=A0A835T763_CHLIN|nr:hypothetical protein HXX76_004295 [Chlamydomonas incerta]|eukprot:KAG2440182.1 hypothetical protein HXX76_004295 [Chlamydomonas incerta]
MSTAETETAAATAALADPGPPVSWDLPIDIVVAISSIITDELSPFFDEADIASAAASCMCVGHPTFTGIAEILYQFLSPRLGDDPGVNEGSTAGELKAVLKAWGRPCTGKKSELWSRIKDEVETDAPTGGAGGGSSAFAATAAATAAAATARAAAAAAAAAAAGGASTSNAGATGAAGATKPAAATKPAGRKRAADAAAKNTKAAAAAGGGGKGGGSGGDADGSNSEHAVASAACARPTRRRRTAASAAAAAAAANDSGGDASSDAAASDADVDMNSSADESSEEEDEETSDGSEYQEGGRARRRVRGGRRRSSSKSGGSSKSTGGKSKGKGKGAAAAAAGRGRGRGGRGTGSAGGAAAQASDELEAEAQQAEAAVAAEAPRCYCPVARGPKRRIIQLQRARVSKHKAKEVYGLYASLLDGLPTQPTMLQAFDGLRCETYAVRDIKRLARQKYSSYREFYALQQRSKQRSKEWSEKYNSTKAQRQALVKGELARRGVDADEAEAAVGHIWYLDFFTHGVSYDDSSPAAVTVDAEWLRVQSQAAADEAHSFIFFVKYSNFRGHLQRLRDVHNYSKGSRYRQEVALEKRSFTMAMQDWVSGRRLEDVVADPRLPPHLRPAAEDALRALADGRVAREREQLRQAAAKKMAAAGVPNFPALDSDDEGW